MVELSAVILFQNDEGPRVVETPVSNDMESTKCLNFMGKVVVTSIPGVDLTLLWNSKAMLKYLLQD